MNTGRQIWRTALAVAAGIVLAGGQNLASAQNTNDERQTNRNAYDSTDQSAENSQRTDRQWGDDQQQSDRQRGERDESTNSRDRDSDLDRGSDRNRADDRSSNREQNSQWGGQNQGRQSDIRFDRSSRDGLVIASIGSGTAFYRSGLREGDVVVSLGGRQLQSADDFYRWSNTSGRVPVVVLRDGQRQTVYIQSNRDRTESRFNAENAGSYEGQGQAHLGVRFEMRFRNGAVISAVVPGSPAEEAGLQSGDEIVAINGRQVESPREVIRIVESMQPGDRIDIEFARRMEQQTQAVLGQHSRGITSARYERGQTQERWNDGQSNRGVEQSSYDESSDYSAPNEYDDGDSQYRGNERGERRGRILPRLRD